jgi:hypothetical protein
MTIAFAGNPNCSYVTIAYALKLQLLSFTIAVTIYYNCNFLPDFKPIAYI